MSEAGSVTDGLISFDRNRDIKGLEVLMTRTLVDIDDEALAAAAAELGTSTKVETVNRALAEIAARPRRLAALERLRTGEDDLGDAEIMRGAWR
jgi:Arc/MetJ family transcription regulator